MFMPNKIKKNWNFKASFDFTKQQKKIQENANNLQKVLEKLRPQTNYQIREIRSSHSKLSLRDEHHLSQLQSVSQTEPEDPFKITSYDGGFKQHSPFIQDQRIQTPNSTRYEYMIGTINEEESKMQELIILNQSPNKQQTLYKSSINSQKDLHLYQTNNFQKIKKHQSSQNPNHLNNLCLGQSRQVKQRPKNNYLSQTSHSKPFISYPDLQKNNNDLVYSGGFLLKPRSKYQSHDYYSKKNAVKNIIQDQQRLASSGSTNIIQVKSLDNIIKQRQSQMLKNKSEKALNYNFDLPDHQEHKIPLQKDSENISKTLRYLQKLQRPASKHEPLSPSHQAQMVASPKQMSQKSKRPMTRSDMEASPMVFQYPIQKVLIKHKDGSMEYSSIIKDNPNIRVKDNFDSLKAQVSIPNFCNNPKMVNQKETQTNLRPYLNSHSNSHSSSGPMKFHFSVEQQKQFTDYTQKKFENYVAKKKRQAQLKMIHRESVNSDDGLSGWETNVWMIRKMRWILWGGVSFIPLYRSQYWDFLGRRVAWKNWFAGWSEEKQKEDAEQHRANWGYKPRYEPVYDFSLKKQKYDQQTREEYFKDTPRLNPQMSRESREGFLNPKDVRTIVSIASEHNRHPGLFDYNHPQEFYSLYPEIEQESFITVGGSAKKRVHDTL